jgi:hypothetical protein
MKIYNEEKILKQNALSAAATTLLPERSPILLMVREINFRPKFEGVRDDRPVLTWLTKFTFIKTRGKKLSNKVCI